jgi:CheY-like chemotaxis protein/signal transduction histidine kinase
MTGVSMDKDRADTSAGLARVAPGDRLRQALEDARATIARLEGELLAAKRVKADFMARMTHEMRTPLSAIIGLAGLAKPLAGEAGLADYLEKIVVSARGLLGVVDDITDFSRLEKGLVNLDTAPFDLGESLSRLLERFAPKAQAKGLLLALSLDPCVPVRLVGDQARLEGVLAHLVGNAVKFTATGRVDIAVDLLWRRDGRVRLAFRVRDTGIGMDRQAVPAMLESFTQADGSLSRPYGGTGLGLALVRHGAALLGGELHVESEPGQGTVFFFEAVFDEDLEREDSAAACPVNLPRPPKARVAVAGDKPLAGVLVLLVEDNAINQQVARELLKRYGAVVDVAGHGREAVDMVGRAFYDVVLMDVQMPVMDGLEATKAIRALPGGADLPIVALTAHALAEDRERCLAAGMNDYLTKPIDPDRLLAVLGQWIASAGVATEKSATTEKPAVEPAPSAPAAALAGGIDGRKALARLGGNERLLRSVAAEFVRDYAGSAGELGRLVRRGDMEGARRLAHTVKGVAGNIAADVLAGAAQHLEGTLAGGAPPEAASLEAYAQALQATVADARRLFPPAGATEQAAQPPNLHLLLVDDAKLNRTVFGQILRGAGHEVTTAENGKQACRLLFGEDKPTRPFDCILMDIEMPEMDGLTACRVIRGLLSASAKEPCARDIPIVALTSHGVEAERERCLAAGMDACLPKIFERDALLDALDAVLRQRGLDRPRLGGPRTETTGGRLALAAILRGLAGHLRAGSIRADEDLQALRHALVGQPEPPELAALVDCVERYAFADALGIMRQLAASLGVDPAVLDKPAEDEAGSV